MEPMLVFSAVLVAYYSYLALLDALRDLREDGTAERLKTLFQRATNRSEIKTTAIVSDIAKSSKIFAKSNKRAKPVPSSGFTEWQRQGALL